MNTILRRYPGYVHGFIHMFAIGRGADRVLAAPGGVALGSDAETGRISISSVSSV